MSFVLVSCVGLCLLAAWPVRPGRDRLVVVRAAGPKASRDGQSVVVLVAVVAGLLLAPMAALLVVALGLARPRWRARRAAADRRRQVFDAVPEATDLLATAVASGFSVSSALAVAARWAPTPVGPALERATHRFGAGRSVAESLEELAGELGPPVRPLVDVLLASERYGVPLGEALDRVAREARLERRRRDEERARRVPVLLLFPLVLCVLPAFGLLTVVPLLVGSLPDLPPAGP